MKAKPKNNKDQRGEKGLFAPGNQFWQIRSKHGRDKLFKTPELLYEACCEYFKWCDENPFLEEIAFSTKDGIKKSTLTKLRPYTIQGLVGYLNASVNYLNQFEESLKDKKDKESSDFSLIITRVREAIYNQKFSGAASGFFNSNIIARDLGLQDKSEVKLEDNSPRVSLEINGKKISLKN